MLSNSRQYDIRQIKPIVYILLAISLGVFLFSVWFSTETRQTKLKIDDLKVKENALENEISKLRVQAKRLHSPENVSKVAKKLDMVYPEEQPIVLEVEHEK